ncbi:MAG: substrate-binding domain-containing protein [Actinomycetota bacterium]|nr:substrate-binding domain-containing protein [Actinomycetota bacterium]
MRDRQLLPRRSALRHRLHRHVNAPCARIQSGEPAGVEFDNALVVFSGRDSGYDMHLVMRTLFGAERLPTAILSSNAKCTMGFVAELQQVGRTDIALVSFGDFPTASLLQPAVTVMNQDPVHLGQAAAERLLMRLDHPHRRLRRNTILPVSLVARGSGELRPTVAPRVARLARL